MKFELAIREINILHSNKWTSAQTLSEKVNECERSIRRHISEINNVIAQEYNIFPYIISHKQKGYAIKNFKNISNLINLNDTSDNAFGALFATPFGNLISKKDPRIRNLKKFIRMRSQVDPKILNDILSSLKTGRELKILHKDKEHHIYPIKLFLDYGLAYLVCFDTDKNHLINMQINRITTSELQNNTLEKEKRDDFLNYVNKAWGNLVASYPLKTRIIEVTVRINNIIKPFFENNPLHNSQNIKQLNDAEWLLTAPVHNLLEFSRYILRFGKHIRAIAPYQLTAHLKRYLSEMLAYYNEES